MEVLQACYILLYRLQKNANICWIAPFLNTSISLLAINHKLCRYSDWLRTGRSGDRNRWWRDFPHLSRPVLAPTQPSVQWVPGPFPGVKSGRGVTLTSYPLLVLWSRKSRAIHLLPLWAVRAVQSLSVCTRVHFAFFYQINHCENSLIAA